MESPIKVITATVDYIPRIKQYDKYGRHSITVVPDDQSIFEELTRQRAELLEMVYMQNNVSADVLPIKPSWKKTGKDGTDKSITFNWSDHQLEAKKVVIFDENDQQYLGQCDWMEDTTLRKAKVKLSFKLSSYCFQNDQGEMIVGVKCLLRKLQVMSYANLLDHELDSEGVVKELVGADF